MNILVTGGAGFIGSHLCERLLSLGHKVVCLDNFNPFYDPEIKWRNLSEIISHPAFKLIEGDIRNLSEIVKCFAGNDIELVIHLAAMAGVRPSMEDPELYADVNIIGLLKLLQLCQVHPIRKFIFASSSSVYGDKKSGAFKEADLDAEPISPYAATKKEGEAICFLWQRVLKIPFVILRFFTCYGPRQRPDLAIHKFTRLLYNNKSIPVYGDGTTSRDYTYIDDTIDGIIKAIDYQGEAHSFEIFNLGESQTIMLKEMIAELEKASGRTAIIDPQPLQPGDVLYTCADITKSRNLLGYNPHFSFQEGIRRFIDWFNSNN
ncbi:MAG: GDP-mannose 4,6-dehydratase [Candidatus Cloacimonadaceae bacterium]